MQRLYTIFDKVSETSGTPFVQQNDLTAIRSMKDLLIGSNTPDDYELYFLGQYDHQKMKHLTVEPYNIEWRN